MKIAKTARFVPLAGLILAFGAYACVKRKSMQTEEERSQSASIFEKKSQIPDDYEKKDGCEKADELWFGPIVSSQYDHRKDVKGVNLWDLANLTALFDMNVSMDLESDELPKARPKAIHKSGSVAQVFFKPADDSPFTGLWADNRACGLIRLSLANKDNDVVIPGLAVKMFVDGKPSQNFVAMYSLDGQAKDYNFFANSFSNIVPSPKNPALKILEKAFAKAAFFPTAVYLQDYASIDRNGNKVDNPVFPVRIEMEPNPALKQKFSSDKHDFRDDLDPKNISSGTELYKVWASRPEDYPNAANDSSFNEQTFEAAQQPLDPAKRVLVGTFISRTAFVSSRWADERLFFKHQRFANKLGTEVPKN
jgi:hypothetical protein